VLNADGYFFEANRSLIFRIPKRKQPAGVTPASVSFPTREAQTFPSAPSDRTSQTGTTLAPAARKSLRQRGSETRPPL